MLTAEILSLITSIVQMLNFQQRYNADVCDDFNGMLKYELRNARRGRSRACCRCTRDVEDDTNNATSDADDDANNATTNADDTNVIASTSSASASGPVGSSNANNTPVGNATASTSGAVASAGASNTDKGTGNSSNGERTVVFREVDDIIRQMRAKLQTLEQLRDATMNVETYLNTRDNSADDSHENTPSDEDTHSDEDVFLLSEPPAKKKRTMSPHNGHD